MIEKLPHFLRSRLVLWVVAFGLGTAQGAVPQLLNHQGRVAVNGVNFDGNGQFKFALVNAEGTVSYWSNDGTSSAGSEPTSHVTLSVTKGLYSALLGDTSLASMTALPPSALDFDVVRLRIWFNDGTRGFQLITPDQRLAAAPYAMLAAQSTSATSFSGSLLGDVTGTQAATTIAAATVTGKALTGFTSAAGEITATDTILSAINKLNGNNLLKANRDSPTFTGTVQGITATMVGLGSVDNTSDEDKPVSAAQLTALNTKADATALAAKADVTALNAKAPLASPSFTGTVTLPAGSATTAPLTLTTGTNLSEAVFGSVEFDGTHLYLTNNSQNPSRKTIAFTDSALAPGAVGSSQLASGLTLSGTTTGSFSGPLTGDVTGNATSATTATSFSGSLLGDVTGTQAATTIAAATVTGKALTGFTSAAGEITATDTILSAINKLNGNNLLKANSDSPTFTGTVQGITATMVGLGNVNDTSDEDKPVSAAQLMALNAKADATALAAKADVTALNAKAPLASPTFTGTVTLPAGSATTAPLTLTTGTNLSAAVFGSVEFDGTHLYLTNNSENPSRKTIAFTDSALASGAVGSSQLASGLTLSGTTTGTFSGPLTGDVTGNVTGNATSATTATSFSGSLLGDVTGTQGATAIAAATVTGKPLTGFTSAAGEILATDTILSAINKLNGNNLLKANRDSPTFTGTVTGSFSGPLSGNATTATTATNFSGSLSGDVTGTQGATAISATTVTDKALTGYVSGAGTLSATDTILSAINKLNGNDALKANLASPTFTGTVSFPAGSTSAAPLRLATGTNLTTAVFGSIEFDGTNLYLTNNSATPTRKTIAFTDSAIANGAVGSSQLASGLTLGGTTTGSFSGPLTGNVTGNATSATTATSFSGALLGDVTGTQGATEIAAATVTGKPLTGYVSGAGTISATDSILSAINKLNGNDALKANLASPTFTGTVSLPAGTASAAPLRLTAGTNLTDATLGAVEFDGNNLYITTNAASPSRKTVAFSDAASSSQIELSSIVAAPLYPVLAWGSNSNNQARAPVLANVAAVAAGDFHSIALLDDGQVVEWGKSVVGGVSKPTLTGVTDIAAGGSHNLVRQSNGRVQAWGDNTYGQAAAPTDIVTAVKVAAGSRHSLALLANGTVRGWGEDYLGKSAPPASLTGMTVIAIAAGQNHSLALKNTGEVVAWGANLASQTDVPVAAQSGVTAIAAGWNHNLALKSDGSVVAWGHDAGGQSTVPAAASSGVVQIAAGDTYSMALKADGTVIAWGYKALTDPVTVVPPGTTQVTQIAAGGYHALALRADSVPAQVARLDSAGRLGIGLVPVRNALEVEGNASKSTAGTWLANSDRRIKTDIESITGALEKLAKVRLVDFRYTKDYLAAHPEIENRRYPNVIAQEFQKIFPNDVKGSGQRLPDGSEILQVDTYPLTIYSAAAVQELHRENRLLKKKLDDQEQRLRKLEEILKNK